MAQWNPYVGIPDQNDSRYEEQNLSSQNYFDGNGVPFSSVPMQTMDYSNYYVPNNIYTNFGTNMPGTVFNVHELEAQQFAASFVQNPNSTGATISQCNPFKPNTIKDNDATIGTSSTTTFKLTATAAEFKPSSSNDTQINSQVTSQTYYRNYNKDEDNKNKGAVRKSTNTNDTISSSEPRETNSSANSTNRYENRRFYNRNNSAQNYYSEEKYRSNNKQDRNNFNKNFRKEESTRNAEVNDSKYNQRQNDYKTDSKFDNRESNYNKNFRRQNNYSYSKSDNKFNKYENREGNYSRNQRDYSERNSERNPRDNRYNNSNNSYRNNRYDKTYENWRSGPSTVKEDVKKNETCNVENNDKDITKSKPFEKERKSFKDNKQFKKFSDKNDSSISQKDRLTDQVNKGILECLVCCERVRQADKIWHCQQCYHIFHFRCIIKWGKTSKDDNGWRCPACQHVCTEIPSSSYCYCGKVCDPQFTPGDTAHSCGDVCGRLGVKPGCIHHCNLLCHPGPCPKCEALISKFCCCGTTKQMVKCSVEKILLCNSICNKQLNCGVHFCERNCHDGDCIECSETIHQDCYCGKSERTISCSSEQKDLKKYSCEQICNKTLKCGNHKCEEICHPGDCSQCLKSPEQVKTCPCGNSKLEIERTSCLDPIPCCGKVCGKLYPLCGTFPSPHHCKSDCHEGDCLPCPLSSFVRCRCGHMSCEILCSKLNSRTDDARCEKKCTKKRTCGRHKCNQLCCIDINHICPLPCNHMLSCGLHRCEQTCHKGRCQPCWRISFDELYCECGASVIYPPIPCGTKRPKCNRPCPRQHECEHETLHTCHNQAECPPCTVLTTKWCFGEHEQRKTIPCHQKEFSCGLPCGKNLSCGRHKCQLPCHKGPCLKEGQNCTQSCTVIRENCGHPCGLPCHESPCPDSPCKESVKVTCECGLRSSNRACIDIIREYQRIATSLLASKMADMQLGHSIDIVDIIGTSAKKQTLKTLECNDECRLIERNRRLAIGLQIRNPDLSAKLTPRYSDLMRQWAKKDQGFCQMVHDKLTELVQLAKQSKQKSRSYSFPSMNREKRHFIHEYCEHFGCESAAYDQEPNRNVVATAAKDKAWLPSCSLLELIQRESGQRKVPGPILNRPLGVQKSSDTVSLKISIPKPSTSTQSTSFASTLQQPKSTDSEEVDYFNYPPCK